VAIVVGLGVALLLAGLALAVRADDVISRVTSRRLGSLAPGFAATRWGYQVYAGLVEAIGLAVLGIGWSESWPGATGLFWAGLGLFTGLSLAAIIGEVRTYRGLKR
jgi:hypothetical protein